MMQSTVTVTPRTSFRRAELLGKGANYNFQRLLTLPYTPDVVEHFIRYFWGTLDSNHESNEEIRDVWCDLTLAIKNLAGDEKRAIELMIEGYKIRDKESGIASKLGVRPEQATKIVKSAYQHISDYLQTDKKNI